MTTSHIANFDTLEYRKALSLFPTGVAIISTTDAEDRPVGLTCNSFSSVSLDPPLVSWSLRKESKSLEAFKASRGFVINILSREQHKLSAQFASSKIPDKFSGVATRRGAGGLPVLELCAATFECANFAVHDAGDHLLFLGKVERFGHDLNHHPLVFCKGNYMFLRDAFLDTLEAATVGHKEIVEARRILHGALVNLACANASDSDLDAMQSKLDQMDKSAHAGDNAVRMEAGIEFFRLIGAAAHNRVIASLADLLADIMRNDISDAGRKAVRPELTPIRRVLLQNLRTRDEAAASRSLEQYLDLLCSASAAA